MEKKELLRDIKKYNKKLSEIKKEIHNGIVGQDKVIDTVLTCILSNGHILLESVPGLAKTLLVSLLTKTIAKADFKRIQFTPDLLPTDITGVTVYDEKRGFYTLKGPIFANIVLADEINRAPPKVQSAMLQAMQEYEVTIGRETLKLPKPFYVLATQNPLEQQGVYPLGVASIDRFLFKSFVDYPDEEAEVSIIDQNTVVKTLDDFGIKEVTSSKELSDMHEVTKKIHLSDEVKMYILDLVDATRNPKNYGLTNGKFIQFGGSPRASIYLGLAARANALMDNRTYVIPDDVRKIAHPVLRHRIILNYEGKAREISTDTVIDEIIKKVPVI